MKDIYQSNDISLVIDNNVLVDLYEIGAIDILFKAFKYVSIPRIIYEGEIQIVVKDMLTKYKFTISDMDDETAYSTYFSLVNDIELKKLSTCDRYAIAIAKGRYIYCSSNDSLVRRACNKYDVLVTGTLGVLGRCFMQNIITKEELDIFIVKIKSDSTSCYISDKVISEFYDQVKLI